MPMNTPSNTDHDHLTLHIEGDGVGLDNSGVEFDQC